ncbi:MAG: hypothetical protein ABWZ66_06295 [Pyrinomonadaceae bacterium]
MTNQQIKQENLSDNSAAEISPAQKVYSFADLLKETQEKLLQMQNTDGDFLKISSGETERRIALLILVIIASIGLAAIVADSSLDLKRIVVFSVDALLLLIWFVYLVRGIFKTLGTPLKNRIYITPTQVIETLDGTVRYRELKDSSEITVNKFSTDIGRRNKLDIKFGDGDAYQFYITGMSNSEQISLMQKWQEKAANWKHEAVSAFQRGDTNYLELQDVFSTLAETNTPVLQRQFRKGKKNLLLIITIAIITLNGAFIFFLTK